MNRICLLETVLCCPMSSVLIQHNFFMIWDMRNPWYCGLYGTTTHPWYCRLYGATTNPPQVLQSMWSHHPPLILWTIWLNHTSPQVLWTIWHNHTSTTGVVDYMAQPPTPDIEITDGNVSCTTCGYRKALLLSLLKAWVCRAALTPPVIFGTIITQNHCAPGLAGFLTSPQRTMSEPEGKVSLLT